MACPWSSSVRSTTQFPFPLPNSSSSLPRAAMQTNNNNNQIDLKGKKKSASRKPRPSFHDQISHKWSRKPPLSTTLPWQNPHPHQPIIQRTPIKEELPDSPTETDSEYPSGNQKPIHVISSSSSRSSLSVAPWERVSRTPKSGFDFNYTVADNVDVIRDPDSAISVGLSKSELDFGLTFVDSLGGDEDEGIGVRETESDLGLSVVDDNLGGNEGSSRERSSPWERVGENVEGRLRGNAEVAEKTIPEHELKRLRNVALRMLERIKVGEAGITQAVVDKIHERWKVDDVVKLKFEGSLAINMRRTHETLERKTGGLVIWRSGSSVVLFRGLNYKLDCVQSYNKQKSNDLQNPEYLDKSALSDSLKLPSGLSEEELMDVTELQNLLLDLGPPFEDWTGSNPKPVDADLLPGVVPGYRRPFRLLPHGVRLALRNKEMTVFRQQARRIRPHFAVGRNKQLEGLAAAMVKLWEKSAIAKIAIKRGVLETSNDRMAEDLKRLTGGTLLSRNKEYIVFYRGNDFLPPAVTDSLKEREEKLTGLQHQEEEAQRNASLVIDSNAKTSKRPLVAGTLAETLAASSRWGKQMGSEDLGKMLKDSAIAKHASLVKYLENKLKLAKRKLNKAGRALAKVQEYLQPAELPSDQEMVTDEERFLLRKMGLSMKPFLLLGRRDVFDGTIQNMHLHWKFRELVKIIVKGKSFSQVKHIAISLEAESGGVFISIDKTTKGYAIIVYRGKNYQKPLHYRPRNLLTRRQALARSIELQRREALKHHVSDLVERIELIKSELDDMKSIEEIDDITLYERLDGADDDDDDEDDWEEDEGEEAYLKVYDSGDDNDNI